MKIYKKEAEIIETDLSDKSYEVIRDLFKNHPYSMTIPQISKQTGIAEEKVAHELRELTRCFKLPYVCVNSEKWEKYKSISRNIQRSDLPFTDETEFYSWLLR
jgi:hypothetical protein